MPIESTFNQTKIIRQYTSPCAGVLGKADSIQPRFHVHVLPQISKQIVNEIIFVSYKSIILSLFISFTDSPHVKPWLDYLIYVCFAYRRKHQLQVPVQ